MKMSTNEVLCDGCGEAIPVMHATAIFATLRGPTIRHKKLDCCNVDCLAKWANEHFDDGAGLIRGVGGEERPAQ